MEIASVHSLQALARARRAELGMRQADLATRAGVSRKWLSEFERGVASAAELPLVLRLLAALDLRLDVGPAAASLHSVHKASVDSRGRAGAGAVDLDDVLSRFTEGDVRRPDS